MTGKTANLYTHQEAFDVSSLIPPSERAYHEQLALACTAFLQSGSQIILLTGPSASGKTTTAKHLRRLLKAQGRVVYYISLDNFYHPPSLMPRWEDDSPNYETVEALNLILLQETLSTLFDQGTAHFPRHDFKTATRMTTTDAIHYSENTVLIFEGIQSLHPQVAQSLVSQSCFRVYINVETSLCSTCGQTLSPMELRFLRRLVRDFYHRASDARHTLDFWGYVLRGEVLYIDPYRKDVDFTIDSTHPSEPYFFAKPALSLLRPATDYPAQQEMIQNLLTILPTLDPLTPTLLPPSSLLREFFA